MSVERDRSCVTLDELRAYLAGAPSDTATRVRRHLEECSQCVEEMDALRDDREDTEGADESLTASALPESIRSLVAAHRGRLHDLSRPRARPARVGFAQVWSTRAFDLDEVAPDPIGCPRIVVVLVDESEAYDRRYPDAIVAPVARPSEEALPDGVEVDAHEGPLGYAFVIEIWNRQGVLTASLDRYLGALAPVARSRLADALAEPAEALSPESGSPEVSRFREREVEGTDYLRAPVRQLMALWAREAAEPAPAHRRIRLVPRPARYEEVLFAASQRLGSGWPVTLEADVEGAAVPLQLGFVWLGFDLVVEHLGPAEIGSVVVRLGPTGREVKLTPGAKGRLGALARLGLSSESRTDEIVGTLVPGLTVRRTA